MKYIADLHIHSPFSRATSKESTLHGLAAWALVKGIHLVGTGDFTHPGWLRHLKENLVPAEPGLFRLRRKNIPAALDNVTPEDIPMRFMLSAEISSIYKGGGKVRKIHNILYVPDFAAVENINARLAAIGNIESDGRPILGLDARDLLEILLEEAPEGFLVPAHVWTPWFSLFGSKSGFDDIEDCFGDLTDHIFALETGLSSDPDMNRRISKLDRFALISNSDCHSPGKLGREANLFATGFDYFSLRNALKHPEEKGFTGTVEFFPEEGKYHLDGHRKCDVCLEPQETRKLGAVCPVCNRPLTVGVLHRVMELADRGEAVYPPDAPEVYSLIPLPEVLGEILSLGPATKGVMAQYSRLIDKFGSEFNILLKTPVDDLDRISPVLGEAVKRIRDGRVIRHGGYDGEFGVITVFEKGELASLSGQINLFQRKKSTKKKGPDKITPLPPLPEAAPVAPVFDVKTANQAQKEAIETDDERVVVTAGPGTGKTFTLVARMVHLIENGADPAAMVAITFTNRAADEMRQRLQTAVGEAADKIFVGTFHAFCLAQLRKEKPKLPVIGPEDRLLLLKQLFPGKNSREIQNLAEKITGFYHIQNIQESSENPADQKELQVYAEKLAQIAAVDLDGIIPRFIALLRTDAAFKEHLAGQISHLFVDEFQDINHGQHDLVRLLDDFVRTFVIGDPNQAIYGFRGGDLNLFLLFAGQPRTGNIHLTANYRSAAAILRAADAVIRHNTVRSTQSVSPALRKPGGIDFYQAATPKAEAEFVVRKIEELVGGVSHFSMHTGRSGGSEDHNISFRDIAVLYRLSGQAGDLEEALSRRGIPVQLVGMPPFFMAPGLRPAYYFIKTAAGAAELAEQLELLKNGWRPGKKEIAVLEQNVAAYESVFALSAQQWVTPRLAGIIAALQEAISDFTLHVEKKGLASAVSAVLSQLQIDAEDEHCRRFIDLAGIFGRDVRKFSAHLLQNARSTVYDERAEAVSLMTVHAAKGLEFSVVFMTGMEHGLFPYRYGKTACDIEEERRLFYVGMTRAAERLILSAAKNRTIFGKKLNGRISNFVEEIPAHMYSKIVESRSETRKPSVTQMKLF